MKRKFHTPEQIVKKLREADAAIVSGSTVEQVCRQLQISDATYYNWRKQYGQMKLGRSIRARDVIAVLEYLFLVRGAPKFIRSDNGPEFIADAIEKWLKRNNVETLHIAAGSPWENGYIESFNGKLRDDVLNREVFHSVKEAKVVVENWRLEYNNHRPHSSLGYMTPAAFAASRNPPGSATLRLPDCDKKNMDNSLIEVGT